MLLDSRARSLHFAVRWRVISRYIGQLLIALALLTCVPLAVAVLSGYTNIALRYLLVVAVCLIVGLMGARLKCDSRLQTNEAMTVSALIFIISGFTMSVPMMGYGMPFVDALFEAVSGVTTTGLSTLATVENRPATFLFARAWLQWVGGLGVLVLVLAMLVAPGAAAKKLGFDEREMDNIAGGARAHARRILVVYILLTGLGIGVLLLLGVGVIDAVVHSFAAVSTGGFSNYDNSLAGFDRWAVRGAISALCIAGAISFAWYYMGFYRRLGALVKDTEVVTLLLLCCVTTALLFLFSGGIAQDNWLVSLGHAALSAISAQTTAGFSSEPLAGVSDPEKLVLIGSMFIGGDLGSTAGGIKILRFLILVRILHLIVMRASMPTNSRLDLRVASQRVEGNELEAALGIVVAYLGVIGVSWLLFLAYGYNALDSLFEVVSAIGTAGLSAGLVGPDLEPVLKGVLCAAMLAGRVETIAILIVLFPRTWIGRRQNAL